MPFMLMTVAGSMVSGGIITWRGRYFWWLVIGPLLGTIGAGLLFTMDADISCVLISRLCIYFAVYSSSLFLFV